MLICGSGNKGWRAILFRFLTLLAFSTVLYNIWKDLPSHKLKVRYLEASGNAGNVVQQPEEHAPNTDVISPSSCPVYSLDDVNNKTNRPIKCKAIIPSDEDCSMADYQYSVKKSTTYTSTVCKPVFSEQIINNICHFQRNNNDDMFVVCNVKPCNGAPIRIAVFKSETGFIEYLDAEIKSNVELEEAVKKLQYKSTPPLTFCILTCYRGVYFIKQALVFPPHVKRRKKKPQNTSKINVNIIVLDSVSRQHFYRKLPASVAVLKNLKRLNLDTTVLDFELFQSIAPRTFPNMRALFSGKVDIDSNDEDFTYGLNDLVGFYKDLGYQALLQEDSCWFDSWGSLVTDNKHIENVSHSWSTIQEKFNQLRFDSYGVTHFSCEVFQQYGKTNQFNYPPKVCYNGHSLPSYYLNYTFRYLQSIEERIHIKPGFLYTHLNTGHETTGKRIAQMDLLLADFLQKMKKFKNTLTIVMSDHGPKTTKYSQQNLAGRLEIGHAFLFMIIPKDVRQYLGQEKLTALRLNQKILFSMVDLYKTFKTLPIELEGDGLLQRLPENRFCDDVPVYSFMNCLCDGGTEVLTETDSLQWISEYIIGYLNQLITESLLASNHMNGYGNCERLIGSRFNKIRRRNNHSSYVTYVIDVLVHKYRGEEIFEVVTRVNKKNELRIEVIKWRRVSIFQHFSKCCDKAVDIQLCICRRETQDLPNPGRDVTRQLSIPSFGVATDSAFLDSKCLLLMKREREALFRTYEITNLCTDRIYHTNFTLDKSHALSTAAIPVYTTVRPWFIHYITTLSFLNENSNPEEIVSFTMENL